MKSIFLVFGKSLGDSGVLAQGVREDDLYSEFNSHLGQIMKILGSIILKYRIRYIELAPF